MLQRFGWCTGGAPALEALTEAGSCFFRDSACSLLTQVFLSTEVLEEALVGSDPEGPLCELLFFFLSAVFQGLDEEQEEGAKEQAEGLSLLLTHFHKHSHTQPCAA